VEQTKQRRLINPDWSAAVEQIEINRRTGGNPYEMCDILYWPNDQKRPDFIIVRDGEGKELIARQAMGAWCEMTPMEIIMSLRMGLRAAV
jgi:hypothetical protein